MVSLKNLNYTIYMFNLIKSFFKANQGSDLQTAINEGAFLVDVRSPQEFSSGSVKGAVNIPVENIKAKLATFPNKKSIVVFCQSGGRSAMAKMILKQNGISNVINGGNWRRVMECVK